MGRSYKPAHVTWVIYHLESTNIQTTWTILELTLIATVHALIIIIRKILNPVGVNSKFLVQLQSNEKTQTRKKKKATPKERSKERKSLHKQRNPEKPYHKPKIDQPSSETFQYIFTLQSTFSGFLVSNTSTPVIATESAECHPNLRSMASS